VPNRFFAPSRCLLWKVQKSHDSSVNIKMTMRIHENDQVWRRAVQYKEVLVIGQNDLLTTMFFLEVKNYLKTKARKIYPIILPRILAPASNRFMTKSGGMH
jgi:hypothetical protein